MAKEIININPEKILLELLKVKLENCITNGVSSEEYFSFVEQLQKETEIKIDNIPFFIIAEEAMKKTGGSFLKESSGIIIKGKDKIMPTYMLTKRMLIDNQIVLPKEQLLIKESALNELIRRSNKNEISTRTSSEEDILIAKKVSSFYINNLIEMYIENEIKLQRWPTQCKNIDEFIFEKDIGTIINEKGTRETFVKAYKHSFDTVLGILETREDYNEEIKFSNNKNQMLAFANYNKMLLLKELEFLQQYNYKKYDRESFENNIEVAGSSVFARIVTFIYSDIYGVGEDVFYTRTTKVDKESVQIMEKRLGTIK